MPRSTKLAVKSPPMKARRARKPVLGDKACKNAQRACRAWVFRTAKHDLAKMRAAAAQMAAVRASTLYHAEYLRCLEQEIVRLETEAQPPAAVPHAPAPAPLPVAPIQLGLQQDNVDPDQDHDDDQGQDDGQDDGDDQGQDDGQDDDDGQGQDDGGDQDQDNSASRGMRMKRCRCPCGKMVRQTLQWCNNTGRRMRAGRRPKPLAGPPCGKTSRELHKSWPLKTV